MLQCDWFPDIVLFGPCVSFSSFLIVSRLWHICRLQLFLVISHTGENLGCALTLGMAHFQEAVSGNSRYVTICVVRIYSPQGAKYPHLVNCAVYLSELHTHILTNSDISEVSSKGCKAVLWQRELKQGHLFQTSFGSQLCCCHASSRGHTLDRYTK